MPLSEMLQVQLTATFWSPVGLYALVENESGKEGRSFFHQEEQHRT